MSMKFNGVICYFEINVADINKLKIARCFILFHSLKKKEIDQMACGTIKLR